MNVYYTTDFTGRWPVGTCAIIVADDEDSARSLLAAELERIGLRQDATNLLLELLDTSTAKARVLLDGNY
jgi:hypothetical protein